MIRFFSLSRILRMIMGGILLASTWLLFFYISIQNAKDYGLAILPALLISIALFIVGAITGMLIPKARQRAPRDARGERTRAKLSR